MHCSHSSACLWICHVTAFYPFYLSGGGHFDGVTGGADSDTGKSTLAKALKESSNGGNKDRIAFSTDPTMQCNVCKARKHEVKWAELRDRGNLGGSLPRGSLCYACH